MKPMMLDLFAGFGGQSEAFLEAGWDILRIDNNPLLSEVPRMVMADVCDLKPFNLCGAQIDYIHASPPCYEFSLGRNAPRSEAIIAAARAGVECTYWPTQGIELVEQAKRIIDELKPRIWSIENVKGSIKFLKPILGEPRLIVGAWVYWGNFPLFDPSTLELPTKASQDRRHSPLRANHRAHIPLCLSQAFLRAIRAQTTLSSF